MPTPEQLLGAYRKGAPQSNIGAPPSLTPQANEDIQRRLRRDGPAPRRSLFSAEEQQRAAAFLSRVVQALQNLNLTAAQPAHDVPAFWSQPVDSFGTVTVAAGAPSTSWVTVVSYTTGPGRWTRIESYGQDVDQSYAYDGMLSFRILMGGQAVPNLQLFTEHRGSAARPRRTFFLSNGDNDTRLVEFQVQRTQATVLPYAVTLSLAGWSWRPLNTYEGPKASQAQ